MIVSFFKEKRGSNKYKYDLDAVGTSEHLYGVMSDNVCALGRQTDAQYSLNGYTVSVLK